MANAPDGQIVHITGKPSSKLAMRICSHFLSSLPYISSLTEIEASVLLIKYFSSSTYFTQQTAGPAVSSIRHKSRPLNMDNNNNNRRRNPEKSANGQGRRGESSGRASSSSQGQAGASVSTNASRPTRQSSNTRDDSSSDQGGRTGLEQLPTAEEAGDEAAQPDEEENEQGDTPSEAAARAIGRVMGLAVQSIANRRFGRAWAGHIPKPDGS